MNAAGVTTDTPCPACGQPGALAAHARVAPFIAELAGWASSPDTSLRACRSCGLAWFSHRYDDATMGALYAGYRGRAYLATRRRWEPWYSGALNGALEPGSAAVDERIRFMLGILAGVADITVLRSVLDYGGDAGQFIPPSFTGPRYVVEVSGREPVQGVRALTSIGEAPEPPHLVIAAHLLEHLVDPLGLVRQIRGAIAPDGLLYVEVPLDRPRVGRWHATSAYGRYLGMCARTRPTWILADFTAGAARNLGWRVPWPGAVKQSEHINYFSERSLGELLERGGFRVLRMEADPRAKLQGLRLGRLGVVAAPVDADRASATRR